MCLPRDAHLFAIPTVVGAPRTQGYRLSFSKSYCYCVIEFGETRREPTHVRQAHRR